MKTKVLAQLIIGLLIISTVAPQAQAGTMVFDFSSGPGPNFTTINSGDLFLLDLDGPTFRVSKEADSGIYNPTGFVHGGIRSVFSVVGDFTITVDFKLDTFPLPPVDSGLNESLLWVFGSTGGAFALLRFSNSDGSFVEVFGTPGGPAGVSPSSQVEGRYRIERVGTTLTGLIAPAGSDVFTTVGSFGGFTAAAFQVQLSGDQGTDIVGGSRSMTALDVSFDNLIIEAEDITGVVPVPEPSTVTSLLAMGICLSFYVWRKGRTVRTT